jgi:hypothetical protein
VIGYYRHLEAIEFAMLGFFVEDSMIKGAMRRGKMYYSIFHIGLNFPFTSNYSLIQKIFYPLS